MERMGDILAKVANRRTALQRRAGNAAPRSTTPATPPSTSATPPSSATHNAAGASTAGRTPARAEAPTTEATRTEAARPASRSRPLVGRAAQATPVGPRASQATKATRTSRPLTADDAPAPTAALLRPMAPAPAMRAAPTARADTGIPTPARPIAPDTQPAEDAEPILELPRRQTPTRAPAAAPRQASAAAMAPGARQSLASATMAPVSGARADFYAPLMSSARRASAGAAETGRAARTLATQRATGPAAQAFAAEAAPPAASGGSRMRATDPDGVTDGGQPSGRDAAHATPRVAQQAPRRAPTRATPSGPAGMLPLGEAVRSYFDAIAPRRRRSAEGDEANGGERAGSVQRALSAAGQPLAGQSLAPEACPICHGAGYLRIDAQVGDPDFGHVEPCVCKRRQIEERSRNGLDRFSSLGPFQKKTFETFNVDVTPGVREAYEAARRYAEDPQGWLILSGGYGVGKTHLAAAIANHQLARGAHVFFSIVPDLLDHLRATFAPNSDAPFDEMFDQVREAEILALDDLGAENSTAWATEKLFQIINYRYNCGMPTVITTNRRLLAHMDERIRSRLGDLSLVQNVMIEAPDYRERHSGRAPRGPANGRARQ